MLVEPFVKSIHRLQGDGALVFTAYEEISALSALICTAHYPNAVAIARKLSQGNPTINQQLLHYAKSCVAPAYHYFKDTFDNDLKLAVSAFKAARYFNPSKINELKP